MEVSGSEWLASGSRLYARGERGLSTHLRMGRSQRRSGPCEEKKNLLLYREQNINSSVV
jgi:hypothetical protein